GGSQPRAETGPQRFAQGSRLAGDAPGMDQHPGHALRRHAGGAGHRARQPEKNLGQMNRKQLTILLVLVVILGAAGWLIRQHDSNSWQSAGQTIGQKLLPDLPVNDITQITIQSGTNELDLAKHDKIWCVRERHDYPANFSQISDLLLKFADLKIAQTEEVGPSQLGRFELLPPGAGTNTGTWIVFKDAGGKSRGSVFLGKNHLNKPAA